MKSSSLLLIALVFLSHATAFGHGEDKPGPHGGFIRMPGAFHTEVVPLGARKLRVHLLDLHFQNPMVSKSSVKVFFNGRANRAKCEKKETAFECELPAGSDLSSPGKLLVASSRNGLKGAEVEYETPLKR